MKIVAIIQARMNSTRLPGKVLKSVLNKPLLEYQIERIKRSKLLDEIVIATTVKEVDLPIIALSKRLGIIYFRGLEADVLARYYGAAKKFQADIIVRLTSDCPIIDPQIIDRVIEYYLLHQNVYDYVSNILKRSYPRGMDTEVFSFESLEKAHFQATKPFEREHVTPFIYKHPELFGLGNVASKEDLSQYRLTVDTPEDFQLIKRIIEHLYPLDQNFTLFDVIKLLDKIPELAQINMGVKQKDLD
ncbi:acylneuraminate cytidylyltransferase [Vulcanibacillus modesticaldus]|uniref:Acylneuraminate cytidylyltransferase n=1 Tax=Vulcanibacillus modesticaldus TaxID=337097 RepID=A0A1D2YT73_9BACI|nr:glycosyltransferase family protein [Vulcanibacillus modesticaldus]OEF98877.1 acylneuraminate cytidylyltransferase [Vulcanibacillus modesticaldus]